MSHDLQDRPFIGLRRALSGILLVAGCLSLFAAPAEVIPPAPQNYFNDYAGLVPPEAARRMNSQLEQFERETSSQVLVAIFPRMQSPSSIEDYTVRVAQSWRAGQKGRDNGAVLFMFVQERRLYLQVGYGLEGVLPDALAKRIIDAEVTPRFRAGDYAGGLQAGIDAILAATRGEYQGTGTTVAGGSRQRGGGPFPALIILLFVIVLLSIMGRMRPGVYRRGHRYGGWTIGSGGFSGRGGFGGGGFGGGFSGGGGRFGGGGAGGSW